MTWVKLDEGFPEHPKIDKAGGDAGWLFVCGLAYCNRNETDGVIASNRLSRLSDRKRPTLLAAKLVDAGLWEIHAEGWLVHDYLHYQPSRSSREQQRVEARERMAKVRGSSSNVRANIDRTAGEQAENNGRSSLNPTRDRPETDPTKKISRQTDDSDTHEQSSSVEAIIELTARAYARKNRPDPDRQYIAGIARNVRKERLPEIDDCLQAGLTTYEAAVRLTGDSTYVELAQLETPV